MTPKRYIIPVFVPHQGCPNDCVFCNQRRISGALEPATGKSVREAIERSINRIPRGVPAELAFYGGSFTAIPVQAQEELLSVALPFLRLSDQNSLRLSTRPDCVDKETADRLLQFGVHTVELGAQSMCDDVLSKSGRGHTARDTELSAAILKEAGLKLILQMMTGLPGDSREKSVYTAGRLKSLKPDGVRIYPTVIIRDTALFDMWRRGDYREHTVPQLKGCGVTAH